MPFVFLYSSHVSLGQAGRYPVVEQPERHETRRLNKPQIQCNLHEQKGLSDQLPRRHLGASQ